MISLFVKTWINDFPWVKQAMISAQKTCKEEIRWGICVDDGTSGEFSSVIVQVEQESGKKYQVNLTEVSKVWPEAMNIHNGYLRQQWIKMNSHMLMGDDRFWIWDSDLIAQKPFSSSDFCGFGDKQIYWFTQFNAMMGGADDHAHRSRMEMIKEVFGLPEVSFEWMRCLPMPQIGGILRNASQTHYWKKSYEMLCAGDARFSEFNIMGQFCHLYFPDAFDWRNTHNYPRTFSGPFGDKNYIVSQQFSWGGMPESVPQFVKAL